MSLNRPLFTLKSVASAAYILLLSGVAHAHSWVEEMQAIGNNGSYTGDYGYTRGYVARTDPGFNGDSVDYLLPPLASGRTRIDQSDLLCHPDQRTSNYSDKYPRLEITANGYFAMKYLENGHVTLPDTQAGKPKAGGTVFIYATTKPSDTEEIVDVLKWTSSGDGGDKRGSLIASNNFDDGRCHQLNSGELSQQRQAKFPDRVARQPTSQIEQWCESDVQIPASIAHAGDILTLYWVWQWPTAPGADPVYPTGKDEYYTSCAEVKIVDDLSHAAPVHALVQQDPQTNAVSDYKSRTAYTTFPSVTLASATGGGYGSASTASSSYASYSSSSSVDGSSAYAAGSTTTAMATASTSPYNAGSSASPTVVNSLPYITYSLSYLPTFTTSAVVALGSSDVASSSSYMSSATGYSNSTSTYSHGRHHHTHGTGNDHTVTETVTAYMTLSPKTPDPQVAALNTAQSEASTVVATATATAIDVVTATATATATVADLSSSTSSSSSTAEACASAGITGLGSYRRNSAKFRHRRRRD